MKQFKIYLMLGLGACVISAIDNYDFSQPGIYRDVTGWVTTYTKITPNYKLVAEYDANGQRYIATKYYLSKSGEEEEEDLYNAGKYFKDLRNQYLSTIEPSETVEEIKDPNEN